MTSILKGLTALIAVLTVNLGGAHVSVVNNPVRHTVTLSEPSARATGDPASADDFWLRGRPQAKATPTPIPTPDPTLDPTPADQSPTARQPLAQLPIAAAPAPRPVAPPAPGPVAPPPAPAPVAPPPAPAPVAPPPAPAPPPIAVGSTQQALINQDRAGAGLGALNWSSCLAGIAYQNALRMANAGAISHAGGATADLGCGLGSQGGENVGYWSGGINDSQLNTMFMNSPGHRANITGPYHYVGTAWVRASNGYAYVAVEFS